MGIEIKYCEISHSYYAEERTPKHKRLGKELQKLDGQIKSLQKKVERIRELDPSFEDPIELKRLKEKYIVLTARRKLEKRVYRLNESDLPEGVSVRILYRKPDHICVPTEKEYAELLNSMRSKAEKRLAAKVSAADNEVVGNA